MIRNIVFDIGGVLTDVRWEFLTEKGISQATADRIRKLTSRSVTWKEFDRAVMEFTEVVEEFARQDPEIADDIRFAFSDFDGFIVPRAFVPEWIRSLQAAGLKVWYLSNMSKKMVDDCPAAFEFMEMTSGGILSYTDKVIKPDAEIYELFLSRFSLVADECVFIDDYEENVTGAEAVGIHGILFESREQVMRELKEKYGLTV